MNSCEYRGGEEGGVVRSQFSHILISVTLASFIHWCDEDQDLSSAAWYQLLLIRFKRRKPRALLTPQLAI